MRNVSSFETARLINDGSVSVWRGMNRGESAVRIPCSSVAPPATIFDLMAARRASAAVAMSA